MSEPRLGWTLQVLGTDRQGRGEFDGGRITETKPVGFPGEGSEIVRVGPLFYWAWATAHGSGRIGLHPHRAFEIMSYVLEGEIGHRDTLGTLSRVGAGGAQVMQTGSGVSHEESMFGDRTDFFQIWFEPDLRTSIQRAPTYQEFAASDFPVEGDDGVQRRILIGPTAPITLETDVLMDEVSLEAGTAYAGTVPAGRTLAAVVVTGPGSLDVGGEGPQPVARRDFVVLAGAEDAAYTIRATDGPVRLVQVSVPSAVPYPLYPKA